MTRMTGEKRNISCVLFLWHLLTLLLASLPFGEKLAIIWRLACFQQPQRSSVLPGAILCLCWDRRIKPELLHVRFPLFAPWLALLYWRPTSGEAEMKKIAEHLRTNSRKTTDKSFSIPNKEALRSRILKCLFSRGTPRRSSYELSRKATWLSLQHFHKENEGHSQANTNTLTHEVTINQSLPLQTCWELMLKTAEC